MMKKIKLDVIDILLDLLLLFIVALLIGVIVCPAIKQKAYIFFDRVSFISKSSTQIGAYYDVNHPNCVLTKEALNNKEACLNNNGVWLYNFKTCLCRPLEVI